MREDLLERIAVALETIAAAVTRPDNDNESSEGSDRTRGRRRRKLPRPTELDVARARKLADAHPDVLTVGR